MDNDSSSMSPYEVREMRRFREELVTWRRDVDSDRGELKHLVTDVHELTKAFESLRKTLLGFALTIAGSAIVFALTVLVATHRLP